MRACGLVWLGRGPYKAETRGSSPRTPISEETKGLKHKLLVSLYMSGLKIELVPFIDKETEGVTVVASIKNISDEIETLTASTSHIFEWEIVDNNGHRYTEPRGALLARHRVKIQPEKCFITALRKLPPNEREKEWRETPSVGEDTKIFTDPVEAANYSIGPDVIRAPTPSPDSDRELSARIEFKTSRGDSYSKTVTFVPSNLSEKSIESVKSNYDVDKTAGLSLTGTK